MTSALGLFDLSQAAASATRAVKQTDCLGIQARWRVQIEPPRVGTIMAQTLSIRGYYSTYFWGPGRV